VGWDIEGIVARGGGRTTNAGAEPKRVRGLNLGLNVCTWSDISEESGEVGGNNGGGFERPLHFEKRPTGCYLFYLTTMFRHISTYRVTKKHTNW
jgi:hypothetical protein